MADEAVIDGPIPAPAGDPNAENAPLSRNTAYPRACGGPSQSARIRAAVGGLSPRLRGTHAGNDAVEQPARPIPAPAGDPHRLAGRRRADQAYPRACGGPIPHAPGAHRLRGLSPRLRGTLPDQPSTEHHHRPIPAPAGDPARGISTPFNIGTYPRACGGPAQLPGDRYAAAGLSPRLRGTRILIVVLVQCRGPIPAPAGDPSRARSLPAESRAYPRACGGPRTSSNITNGAGGLSPRLRGTRVGVHVAAVRAGPIPAPAGDPRQRHVHYRLSMAYPRACGGPEYPAGVLTRVLGLSPRLRGTRIGAAVQ